MKVFLSQPMSGVPESVVIQTRNAIKKAVLEYYPYEKDIEFVSAYENTIVEIEFPHPWSENICYLSKALHMLKDIDAVAFSPDLFSSRGCIIEFTAALMYGIKTLHCVRTFDDDHKSSTYKIEERKYTLEFRDGQNEPYIKEEP